MIPRPHTGVMRRRATFHPPSATWAATTKSLNWVATAKSVNCPRQRGTLGLSEAAASRQTGQSEGWGVTSLATQFANRMAKLEALLNSDDFPSRAGGGLEAVAQALHRRCARVVELHGGRLRT